MNRYVLSAISLLLLTLTGCSDSLQESTDSPSNGTIRLTTTIEKRAGTRGTPVTSASSLSDMGLYCYHTGFDTWSTAESTATPNKMNHTEWTQSAGVWSSESPVTWGTDVSIAEKFTFWGYAPYATGTDSEGNGLTIVPPVGGKGFPKLTYTVPTDITKQPDLMVAVSADKHVTPSPVNLSYKHALTCIAFKAKGSGQKITAVKVKGVSATGTLSVDAAGTPTWSNLSAPGTIEYTAGLNSSEITTEPTSVDILNADGYLMMIPQTLTADAQLVVTVDNDEYTFNLSTQDIATWAPGQLLTYGIDADKCKVGVITDYRDLAYSNCYIINPSTEQDQVYKIPVGRVNEFWAAPGNTYLSNDASYSFEANDGWYVKLLWATTSELTLDSPGTTGIYISKKTGVGPNDYFEITVPKGMATTNRGNFTVSIHANANPSWSWHFWVTDYNPYGEAISVENSEDDGQPWAWDLTDGSGSLFRVGPNSGIYAGKRIMDRPLGHVEGQGPLYYQFGRKDPFPNPDPTKTGYITSYQYPLGKGVISGGPEAAYTGSNTYKVSSYSGDPYSYILFYPHVFNSGKVFYETHTTEYSMNYTYYLVWNQFNFANNLNGVTYAWNDPKCPLLSGKKSIFDPSPYGFKIPEKEFFSTLMTSAYDADLKGYVYDRTPSSNARSFKIPFLGLMDNGIPYITQAYQYTTPPYSSWTNPDANTQMMYFYLSSPNGTSGIFWTSTPHNVPGGNGFFESSGGATNGISFSGTSTTPFDLSVNLRAKGYSVFCVEE